MTPDDLLVGPRGRRLCFELAGGGWLERDALPTAPPGPVDPAGVLDALHDAADRAMYWQEPDDTDVALASAAWREWLRPVAAAAGASPAALGWDAPVAAEQFEVRLRLDETPSEPVELLPPGAHWAPLPGEPDWRMISGNWWSAPIDASVVATTGAPDGTPLGLRAVEDHMGWQRAGVCYRPVTGSPRVLELVTPDDWTALVRTHAQHVTGEKRGDWWRTTGRDGVWLMPDWASVGERWDAVHLTIGGYLRTAGRALPVDGDAATVLAGWDPDATFWLGDAPDVVGDPVEWVADDDLLWRRG